jgi:DNA-directed RNA polymerase subunit RPC12/RpoP
MGAMVQYRCPKCRYESERLTLGPAPHPDRFDPALASCPKCKRLLVINLAKKQKRCPSCKSAVVIRTDENYSNVPCPQCSERLVLTPIGLWD